MAALTSGILILMAGCTTTEGRTQAYQPDQDGVQVLKTEPADCGPGHSGAQAAANAEEVRFTLASKQDVDTAYARIKRAFGFQAVAKSASRANAQRGSRPQNTASRKAPDIAYSLRGRRQIGGRSGVIQIDIERAGSGSRLAVLYYAGGKEGFPLGEGFRRLVEDKIQKALNARPNRG